MSSIDNQDSDRAALLTDFALDELQLRDQPFTTAPREGESFLDSIAEAQLDDIKQALISGDDLLLILGPEGSGKSTLLAQLGTNSGQRIQCFSVRGSDRFSTSNLFSGMLEAFKKEPPNDLKLMLDDLIPCLQGMADQNTLGAVVLDDADLIPESELTKLLSGMLYINSSDETLLRVTLAAPTEFEERIPELLPEGADLPYSSLAIDAFDKDRSAAYLHYRLQQAGAGDAFPFSEEEITAINAEAGGRPGHLHTVAAQQLNSRDANYVPELPPELIGGKKAAGGGFLNKFGGAKLIAGALALLMIFAGLFLLKPSTNNVPDDRYKVVENKKIEASNNEKEIRLLNEQKLAEQKLAAETAAVAAANEAAESTNSTQATTPGNTTTANNSVADAGQAAKAAADKAAADAAAKAQAAKAEAQKQAKLEREAAEKAQQEKLAQEKAAKEKAAKEEAAKVAEAKAAADEAAKAKSSAALENLNNLESANWILVQKPTLFTVQMMADTNRTSVENFLSTAKLDAPNSIFSFNRDGVTWYALVHGLYNSIEEARLDIEKMPAKARNNQPWIRAVGRIQNALKEQ